MNKRSILALMLVLALVLTMLPTPALAAGERTTDFAIELTDDQEKEFWVDPDGTLIGYFGKGGDVVVPEGVRGLYKYISWGNDVTSITLPSTLQTVSAQAFVMVGAGLRAIYVDEANPYYTSHDGVLYSKDMTTLVYCPRGKAGSYVIPDGVTQIEARAFVECCRLTGVTIPNSVKSVGEYAFAGSGLFYVNLGNGITWAGSCMFSGCDNLTSIVLPDGTENLDLYQFIACRNLKSVYIPRSLTSAAQSFRQCDALTDVYYEGSEEDWAQTVGLPSGDGITIHYNYGAQASKALSRDMFSVDTSDEDYTGSPITKTIVGVDGDKTLVEGVDYAVSYTANTCLGGVGITITGMGDYKGTLYYAFTIRAATPDRDDFLLTADGILFYYRGTAGDVVIPEGVVYIDTNAFELSQTAVTNLTIPSTVTDLGRYGVGAPTLTDIRVAEDNPAYCSQDGVLLSKDKKTLVKYPAARTGSYTIPDSVETIMANAFYVSKELTELTIPRSVTVIEPGAFRCEKLTGVQVDESNANFLSQNGVLFTKDKKELVTYPATKEAEMYEIPDGVEVIREAAFYGCSALNGIVVPKSLTTIQATPFPWCDALGGLYYRGSEAEWANVSISGKLDVDVYYDIGTVESGSDFVIADGYLLQYKGAGGDVVIPEGVIQVMATAFGIDDSVTSVTLPASMASVDLAFINCSALSSIQVASGNSVYASRDGVLFNAAQTKLLVVPNAKKGSYVVPSVVNEIDRAAFWCCAELTSIEIPSQITTLPENMFLYCDSLTSVTLPASLESADPQAFSDCSKLINIVFKKGETKLDPGIDYDVSCTKNDLGQTGQIKVTGKGDYAGKLEYTFQVTDGVSNDFLITNGALIKYMGTASRVAIPDGVTTIAGTAFSYNETLTGVTIPDSVTAIEGGAFTGCSQLTELAIPASVTDIGSTAFDGCESLQRFTVAAGNPNYTDVDGVLFNKAKTKLVRYPGGRAGAYTVPDGVREIGDWAFYWCPEVTEIAMPDSVTTLGLAVFSSCPKLSDVTLSTKVTTIPKLAFGWCAAMTDVTIPQGVTTIGEGAFNGCSGLVHVVLPDGVVTLREASFAECSGLKDIVIPKSVTSISSAFRDCIALTDIYYTGSEAEWSKMANMGEGVTIHYNYGASEPSQAPSVAPSASPSQVPSEPPAASQTAAPSQAPSDAPSQSPEPSTAPTDGPTESQSPTPSVAPSDDPTQSSSPSPSDPASPTPSPSGSGSGGGSGSRPSGGGSSGGGGSAGGGGAPATSETAGQTTPALFTDVEKYSWYEAGVNFVVEYGLFNGVGNGLFAPYTDMTRAMLMTVLARLDGQDTSGGEPWYQKGVGWAMVQGISDGSMPDSNVTREQMVAMLYRYAKSPSAQADLATFADGERVSEWAKSAVEWAVSQGILTGKDAGRLDPQGTATRAEVATILQRFVEKTRQ